MPQWKNAFCKAEPGSKTVMIRAALRQIACLAAVCGVLGVSQTFAKDPTEPEARPNTKVRPAIASAAKRLAELPECLERLKLSPSQQSQAEEIIRKFDAKIDATWTQFGDKYMETVRTEVSLLASIEDNLTEAQRMQVRDQRRQVAHAEKALEGTNSKPNQAAAKPVDPVEQEITGAGVSLTSEQEAAADKIHQKYVGRLRSLNRDVQGIHARLVSLEADKLVELEKLLTKEQLVQLREARQMMTGGPKVTAANKASTTTE